MKKLSLALIAGLAGLAASPAVAGGHLKPGKYEVTVKMEMPGSPVAIPETRSSFCVTPKDAEDDKSLAQRSQREGSDCKVTDWKMDGNKSSWTMECTGKQKMKGSGEMVFSTDGYESTMKMHIEEAKRGPMDMTQHMKAKRVGDCP